MVTRQLSVLTIFSFTGAGVSYAFSLYLANGLGPELYGRYSYILLISSLVILLTNYSTDATAPSAFARGQSSESIYSLLLGLRIVMFIAGGLISSLWLIYSNSSSVILLGALLFSVAGFNLSFLFELDSQNVRYGGIYLFERVAYAVLGFFLVSQVSATLSSTFIAFALATFGSVIFQYVTKRKYLRSFRFPFVSKLQEILLANFPLFLVTMSQFAYGGLSRIIFEFKYGMADLALYSLGFQLTVAISIFQSQVVKVYRLRFSRSIVESKLTDFLSNLRSYLLLSTAPVVAVALLVTVFRHELVAFLFIDDYSELAQYIYLFAATFIVINIHSLITIFWIAIGKNRLFFAISVSYAAILLIVLSLLPRSSDIGNFVTVVLAFQILSVLTLALTFAFKFRAQLIASKAESVA